MGLWNKARRKREREEALSITRKFDELAAQISALSSTLNNHISSCNNGTISSCNNGTNGNDHTIHSNSSTNSPKPLNKLHELQEALSLSTKVDELAVQISALSSTLNSHISSCNNGTISSNNGSNHSIHSNSTSDSRGGSSSSSTPLPKPPPGANKLLKFLGSCEGRGVALFVGTPHNQQQPNVIVVGYSESTTWTVAAEVEVKLNGKKFKGEVASVGIVGWPWVCIVELLDKIDEMDGVPLWDDTQAKRRDEVVLLRQGGAEIPGTMDSTLVSGDEVGKIPGARMGDLLVHWNAEGKHSIGGILTVVEEDGGFCHVGTTSVTLGYLYGLRKSWYYKKYPDREPQLPWFLKYPDREPQPPWFLRA